MQEPQETWVRSLGQEDPLEKGIAIHSSILALRSESETQRKPEVPASPRGEALFRCARPSGVPRGPAPSTGSLASQRHPVLSSTGWHVLMLQFSSVQSLVVSDSLRPHKSQHARPPCPSPTPGMFGPQTEPELTRNISLCVQHCCKEFSAQPQ